MKPQDVIDAMTALEAEGIDVTNAKIRARIGRGSLRDVQRIRREIAAQTIATATATAVADEPAPEVAALVEDPDTILHDAQECLEVAQHQLARLETELAPILGQNLSLVTATKAGVISRRDPAWHHYDQAAQQLYAATMAVRAAEEDLARAQRIVHARLRERALETVAATPEGKALLGKIADCQAQRKAADGWETQGMYVGLGMELGRLNTRLQHLIDQHMPQPDAPKPVDLTPLRQYYEDRLDHTPTTLDLSQIDAALLRQVLDVVQTDYVQAQHDLHDLSRDEQRRHYRPMSDEQLPLRQAQERTARCHSMTQMIQIDLRVAQQREQGRAR